MLLRTCDKSVKGKAKDAQGVGGLSVAVQGVSG